MQKETIQIEGMSCNHCVATVTRTLEEQEGVRVEQVEIGKAVIELDPALTSMKTLVEAIEETGFDVIQPA